MSGALIKASRLRAEIRLAQAISQFEVDLSSEQKATFRTYKSQSRDSPPGPGDVMKLTAEIDYRVSRKASARCFGPRLTFFLQAVQQFAALGDVVIGGSQNLIACSIWSLVRFSLLSIVNFTSYFEKLSELLMKAGRSAPRHQLMALLYPKSKKLQSHVCEYFIVVVRICHRAFSITQKSAIGQFASTLSDADLKTYQSELDQWASLIKEEESLLLAENIQGESHENSRFRALSSNIFESISLQQKAKRNLRVLDFCSIYDIETVWKQTRKIGNTSLFNRSVEYKTWKEQVESCTILYAGKLGSGKSVLLANIIDDLHFRPQRKDITIAYYFCRHDIPESLKARTIIGSLARQLLRPIPDLSKAEEVLNEAISAQNIEVIYRLLQRALPPDYKAYFILDGLDEFEDGERNILVKHLQMLQEVFVLLLCVSLRLETNNTLKLRSKEFTAPKVILFPEDNPDIGAFIEAELARRIESKSLVIGNHVLILEIHDALLKGSQGMFLWASLQIESLCVMKTDNDIRQALENLPNDLPELFSRILQRSRGRGEPSQKRILELVTVARQPLTTGELRHALSVVPGDCVWNPQRLVNDIFSALACCGSLLIVDEEELTVRLVHHSVKQFLLGGFENLTDIRFTMESANKKMAELIITYLNYDVFNTQLSTTVIPQIMIGTTPSKITQSTDSPEIVQRLALRLLKSRKTPDYDIGKTVAEISKLSSARSTGEFPFYLYAKSNLLQHVFHRSEKELVMYDQLLRLFRRNTIDITAARIDGQTLLEWAFDQVHGAALQLLVDSGKFDTDLNGMYGQRLLFQAAKNGHGAVVKVLLDSNKVDANSRHEYGQTPLILAAEQGHEAVVKVLLDSDKIDANSRDELGWTALLYAANNGHGAVVKVLLDSDKGDAESRNRLGWTALILAAEQGHEAVVQVMLDSGKVDAESRNRLGWTALSHAAKNGHEAVVKVLLDSDKVDANSMDEHGLTPLIVAAMARHEAVIKTLLDSGKVDVELRDGMGQTALEKAIQCANSSVVSLLRQYQRYNSSFPLSSTV